MAIGRITYLDKKDYKIEGADESYRVNAKDMNEIKDVFNTSAETIELTEKKVEDAIEFIGTYKFENGLIYFKQANGTWGEGIALAGQTTISLDEVVQENLTMSSVRDTTKEKVIVQLQGANGNPIVVEVDSKNCYRKSNDGTKEIKQSDLDNLISKLINLIPFWDSSPKSILDELNKFVDIT